MEVIVIHYGVDLILVLFIAFTSDWKLNTYQLVLNYDEN